MIHSIRFSKIGLSTYFSPLAKIHKLFAFFLLCAAGNFAHAQSQAMKPKPIGFQIAGVSVTPHVRAESLRYAADAGKATGALIRVFVRNPAISGKTLHANEVLCNGRYPLRLLMDGQISWHDTPNLWQEADTALPPGAVSVWTLNGLRKPYKAGGNFTLTVEDWANESRTDLPVAAAKPSIYLSSVTFLSSDGDVRPDRFIFHVANEDRTPLQLQRVRLYLPPSVEHHRYFLPISPLVGQELSFAFERISRQDLLRQDERNAVQPFPFDAVIPAQDRGGATIVTGKLPLTYAVLEVNAESGGKSVSLWAKVRIKRETFDISGGWINDTANDGTQLLSKEPYLKTLKRMHINTGHIGMVPGYTDDAAKYARYPLKFFGGLEPLSDYTAAANLGRVHGIEALGEPQLGFSKDQRTPQEVWKRLDAYAASPFATTLTLNDESNWRYYAGLSDFPHHDNYRVTAPSADVWQAYDWGKNGKIGWGAPLETVGDLCRSLRDMSRPAPTAYWSQAASAGWDIYDGRARTSPTPDELRMQAYHALATRITSLYWFNPSLKGIVKFRDLIEPITLVGREMRTLEEFYLTGDAYAFRREQKERGGAYAWELSVIASPKGALLFALDCDYQPAVPLPQEVLPFATEGDPPDANAKTFVFGERRNMEFSFRLPAYLRPVRDVFRIDAEGTNSVIWTATPDGVRIGDVPPHAAIYVAVTDSGETKARLLKRIAELKAEEKGYGFDPARNDADFATLKALNSKR